jgi:hypothetical protein
MIHLHFKGYGPAHGAVLGPAASFRIAGNFIRDAESGEILARYLNHFWHVQELAFTRYDCPDKVFMHFEDIEGGKTPYYGPFSGLSVADGSVHEKERLVAKFIDPTLLWHDIQSDTYWQYLILSDKKAE